MLLGDLSYIDTVCDDVLSLIFLHLRVSDLRRVHGVCKRWKSLVEDNFFIYQYGLYNAISDRSVFIELLRKKTRKPSTILLRSARDQKRRVEVFSEKVDSAVKATTRFKFKPPFRPDRFVFGPHRCFAYETQGHLIFTRWPPHDGAERLGPRKKHTLHYVDHVSVDHPIQSVKIAHLEDKRPYLICVTAEGPFSNHPDIAIFDEIRLRRIQEIGMSFSISYYEFTATKALFLDHQGTIRIFPIIYDEIEQPDGSVLRLPGIRENPASTIRVHFETKNQKPVSVSFVDVDGKSLVAVFYDNGQVVIVNTETSDHLVSSQVVQDETVTSVAYCPTFGYANYGCALLGTLSGRAIKINVIELVKKQKTDPKILFQNLCCIRNISVNWEHVTAMISTLSHIMLVNVDSGRVLFKYPSGNFSFFSSMFVNQ